MSFGGFSPTLLGELQSTKEQVIRLEEENARRREMLKRQHELEFARTSKPMRENDGAGTSWVYVVVDDRVARIVGCETEAATICIPEEVGGFPVYAIAADACSRNDFVEEINCPNALESIGSCAFRFCKNLRRVVFPEGISTFDASWLSHCPNIEEIVLPGLLEEIDSSVFDNEGIRRLVIGKSVRLVKPGAFQKSRLEEIRIHPDNPYLKTDGDAIYTADGSVFLALARPLPEAVIRLGCTAIAKKALYGVEDLKKVRMPIGLRVIGEFSFAHSGVEEIACPDSLKEIQAKAFLFCGSLESVELNEGLEVIGESAFEHSGIAELCIPHTIREIGASVTKSTDVVHCGSGRTFLIDERNELLFTDGQGGLYRRDDDGIRLIQLIDPTLKSYTVCKGARVVGDHAFAFNPVIEEVVIPDGVEVIEASAFRVCQRLGKAIIADSVIEIGEEAFLDTSLEEFRVPASLRKLGRRALVTYGAHHGDQRPSLRRVQVAEGNDRFTVECGILCRRVGDSLSAIAFTSSEPAVVFPENLTAIEDYAFNNARNIEYLSVNANLQTIGTSGLTTWCWIKHIHVEVAAPIEGRSEFDFFFPDTSKSLHGISTGLGGASWMHVPGLVAQYDICVVNAHDYSMRGNYDSISVYDQAKLVLGRLKDPFLLTDVNRKVYERLVRTHLGEMCVDIARHDDRQAIDDLLEFGFLDADNIEQVIEQVGKLQDAAMTGYLLEVKRMRFNKALIDFDL